MTGLTTTSPCPSQDDLAHFQRGEAPSGRIDELAEHLEICNDCQAALAHLSVACDELRQLHCVDQFRRQGVYCLRL
jgi:hypothetical protein